MKIKKSKETFKENKGITLMLLVIIIIILLILSGITIATLTGDNGLIKNSKIAKEETEISNEKEIVETSVVQTMQQNKYGNIEQSELQEELDKMTGKEKTDVKIIRKKLVVEFTNSHRMYKVDDNGNVSEYVYKDLPLMERGLDFQERIKEYKNQILNIKVVDYDTVPNNAITSFDVSKNQDKSIMAWFMLNETNNEFYDLYIGGYDGVEATNCQNMFLGLENVLTIDLSNLYTDNVTNFGYMFQQCINLQQLDISNLNTSTASQMGSLFANCKSLKTIDVSNFDTSNCAIMSSMFNGCNSLETIDLSNFNTSKVVDMNYMFAGNSQLKTLDLSSFDTKLVTNMTRMFELCTNLETIYVSEKWNNSKVTRSDMMFHYCYKLVGKIPYDSTKLDITYANYENGYFTLKT